MPQNSSNLAFRPWMSTRYIVSRQFAEPLYITTLWLVPHYATYKMVLISLLLTNWVDSFVSSMTREFISAHFISEISFSLQRTNWGWLISQIWSFMGNHFQRIRESENQRIKNFQHTARYVKDQLLLKSHLNLFIDGYRGSNECSSTHKRMAVLFNGTT